MIARALACGLALALASPCALAERADRTKPINIESDRLTADDAKQTTIFEGRVILTQGTLQLRADRLTVRQDKAGNQFAIAVGNPATFRQKRDGADEWIDGEALRIEYDSQSERVQLFDRARVARDQDVVRGNYIVYEQRTETLVAQDSKEGPARSAPGQPASGRVTTTIQPKARAGENATAAPLELKPNPSVTTPR